jgi:hypothetical protein
MPPVTASPPQLPGAAAAGGGPAPSGGGDGFSGGDAALSRWAAAGRGHLAAAAKATVRAETSSGGDSGPMEPLPKTV